MQKKTPDGSILPEATPDSELEKYGVWVKAEPQDILTESEPSISALDEDFTLPEDDTGSGFEDFDSEIDFSLDEDETADDPAEVAPDSEADDFSIEEEADDELPVVDFDLDDSLVFETIVPDTPEEETAEEDISELEAEAFELDAEAFEPEETSLNTEGDNLDMDNNDFTELSPEDFGLDFDDAGAKDNNLEPEIVSVDLSEFGIEEETAKQDEIIEKSNEFQKLEIDLEFDDTIPAPSNGNIEEDLSFLPEEVEEIESDLPDISTDIDFDSSPQLDSILMEDVTDEFTGTASSMDGEAPYSADLAVNGVGSFIDEDDDTISDSMLPEIDTMEELNLDGTGKIAKSFDDVGALERELADDSAPAASSALLRTIAEELASIKSELHSLRSQLGNLRQTDIKEEDEDLGAAGFFDDEEDETIALTGDELDNILNTADFTMESSEAEEAAQAEAEKSDLLPEDGDYESLAVQDDLEPEPLEDLAEEPLDLTIDFSEDDIVPVTEAPDDTTYLEEDSDEFSLDTASFEESDLVAPDLSEFDLDFNGELHTEDVYEFDSTATDEILEELDSEDEDALSLEPVEDEELILDSIELEPLQDDEVVPDEEFILDAEPVIDEIEELDEELVLEAEPVIDGLEEVEEIEEIEALDDLSIEMEPVPVEDFDEVSDSGKVLKPAEAVTVHPDEMSLSLDNDLFVEAEEVEEQEIENKDTAPSDRIRQDVKTVLLYLDQLLSSLPEEKIEEFASSEYYDTYKKLFDELGLL